MRGSPTPTAAAIVVALAVVFSGCVNDEPKNATKSKDNSAVAECAGYECKVTARCKGRVYRRYGPAPVKIQTSKTALRTTIYADFAGSRNDAVIRC